MDLKELKKLSQDSMVNHLGIELIEFNGDEIIGTMPVDSRTQQPFKILHGGATVALAETLGSFGSFLNIDPNKFVPVGMEINCNHLRSVRSGLVKGVAKLKHKGKKVHVWNIDVFDDKENLIAVSRLSVMILPKQ